MIFTIYLITNKLNGKVYVGQTRQTILRRWRGHLQDARRGEEQPLYRAIRKYGKENFSIDPILTVETQENADYQERAWIILMGAHVSKHGYVCTWGGDGRTGISEETQARRTKSFRKTLAHDPTKHPRYRDDIKDEEIIRLCVDEVWSMNQIAEKMKCSRQLIKFRLKRLGIKVGKGRQAANWVHHDPNFLAQFAKKGSESRSYKAHLDTKEMLELHDAGLSFKRIGKMLGCAPGTVTNRLRSMQNDKG